MPRLKGNKNQRAFLAAFATCGQITKAAKIAGVDRHAHYDWLATDPSYPERFAEADRRAGDFLEDEATRRGVDGVLQAEYYQGRVVGSKRVYSDNLLAIVLRARKPDKYRERGAVEVTGKDGAAIATSLTVRFVKPNE